MLYLCNTNKQSEYMKLRMIFRPCFWAILTLVAFVACNNDEEMSADEIKVLGKKAKERIKEAYSWEYIAERYEKIFLSKKE